MFFLVYFRYADAIPMKHNAMPIAIMMGSGAPLSAISEPSQKPKGVMYLRKFAGSAMFDIKFRKYITAAMPRPIPVLLFRMKEEMPKHMPASSI